MNSAQGFQSRLLSWYKKESRKNLPWRKSRDPYRVWISEMMLQQTQVATVIPYYERFLLRFPTVEALSEAPVTAVLDHWSGLGYYTRAKNLHSCARQLVREQASKLPSEVDELMELPGIGRTTAGAIASIAYDRPAPILDGNVQRVLSRFFGLRGNPRRPEAQRELWRLAGGLVPESNPGNFNQALMDLGATVCTPRQPRCSGCPISGPCVSRKNGWQEIIPPPRDGTARRKVRYLCAITNDSGSFLLARRPLTGLLPGLWEFPGGEAETKEPVAAALRRITRERLGVSLTPWGPALRQKQILSHREMAIEAYPCRWGKSRRALKPRWYMQSRWVQAGKLRQMALTAGMRRLAEKLSNV